MKNSSSPVVVLAAGDTSLVVDGEAAELTGPQRRILALLASDPHRVRTKTELLRAGWGREDGAVRPVDVAAVRLRRLLADAGADSTAVLVNVWGVGYRLQDASDASLTVQVR